MTILTFPTMADKAITEWLSLTKTTPFATVAKKCGAFKDGNEWIFDDDSRAVWSGHGRAYKLWSELP